jgi:aminoglycoside phosphotransferase (APT) family kinase protein
VRVQRRRLSDVARVELTFPTSTAAIYVKSHRKAGAPADRVRLKAAREFETLADLYPRFLDVPGCGVARPIAYFPEHMTVVTSEVQGQNFHVMLKRQAVLWRHRERALSTQCQAAGIWLRHFQRFTDQGRTKALPVDELLEEIRTDVSRCVDQGMPASAAEALLDHVRARAARATGCGVPVVGEHPDFQPDNILIADDGVTVIDFTSFQLGAPHSDVARFLASVMFLAKSPLYPWSRMQRLATAFLRGYGWEPEKSGDALTLYLTAFMARAAATVAAWPHRGPVKRAILARTMSFMSTWARASASGGGLLGRPR